MSDEESISETRISMLRYRLFGHSTARVSVGVGHCALLRVKTDRRSTRVDILVVVIEQVRAVYLKVKLVWPDWVFIYFYGVPL